MAILVIGINHKTASVALREKVAFSTEKSKLALMQLKERNLAKSAVILSTCNRTEIYLHHKKVTPQEDALENQQWRKACIDWFSHLHQVDVQSLKESLYCQQNMQAVIRIMKVACGLDSLILGEPQILGQVKQAYHQSDCFYAQHGGMSSELSRLFQKVFATAKRVRSETAIGTSAVSVAYAACSLARQIFDSFKPLHFLLIGAGETIALVSRYLIQHGAENIQIANRTLTRAEKLVAEIEREQTHIDVLPLTQLEKGLEKADIIISSTGSPDLLIHRNHVQWAQKKRLYKPLLIIDIAVPRDIDDTVGELEGVYYYSVDDLQNIIQHNLEQRQQASEQAFEIIVQEAKDYFSWLKLHQSAKLIKTYRHLAFSQRDELLEKAVTALSLGEDPATVLQEFGQRLTNRLIHTPTKVIQTLVQANNTQGLQSFSYALGLESPHTDSENASIAHNIFNKNTKY